MQKKSKYGAKKVRLDSGEVYDSKHEYERGLQLQSLLQSGEISDLQRQVKYELIPAQKDKNGKSLERSCTYIADYVYKDKDGNTVVEDCKGFKTPEYKIKRKLLLYRYGIRVVET